MQRFSPEIPWVLLQQDVLNGSHEQRFDIVCEVCGARGQVPHRNVAAWVQSHRAHQAPKGSLRLGDAFAAVAKPVARAVGIDPNCTPCEARRRAMNDLKRFW
jgi:hypothetical protein